LSFRARMYRAMTSRTARESPSEDDTCPHSTTKLRARNKKQERRRFRMRLILSLSEAAQPFGGISESSG
jgi:hypothetical protein